MEENKEDQNNSQKIKNSEKLLKATQENVEKIKGLTIGSILRYLRFLLNLRHGSDEELTVEEIKSNIEFRGANLWILAFSIFIASIGLNTNSTAVIIGAMLISPLMGPIMGLGLAVGINDLEMLKKSLRNLLIAVFISVFTSTIYFWLSPLSEAQSELLARTQPTFYDVLIAIFGGLSGIVGASRKLKGNVIPGVAIATALMPPLCTAGYGIATGETSYFFGAFYLFFINSFFISLSTLLIVRVLKFKPKSFVDKAREKKATRYILFSIFITILPSIWIGYNVISQEIYERQAESYISENFEFENTRVSHSIVKYDSDTSRIEIYLAGKILPDPKIKELKSMLERYGLDKTKLIITQDDDLLAEFEAKLEKNINSGFNEIFYRKNEEMIKSKDAKIEFLENELIKYRSSQIDNVQFSKEISAIFPEVENFAFSYLINAKTDRLALDTIPTAIVKVKKDSLKNKLMFSSWLKNRLNLDTMEIISR